MNSESKKEAEELLYDVHRVIHNLTATIEGLEFIIEHQGAQIENLKKQLNKPNEN